MAIEVKISSQIRKSDLKGIFAFGSEHGTKLLYVISLEPRSRKLIDGDIEVIIINYKEFLKKLWGGKIINDNIL